MSFLNKMSKGFGGALGSVFSGPGDLEQLRLRAETAEFGRLKKFAKAQREEAQLATTEGVGVSERPDVSFGDQTDLEDLSAEEREFRSSGRRDSLDNTGLLL